MTRRATEPFFIAPGRPEHARGRLLLISYHFPPGRAAGVLRWQKMAGYAAERGWGMDVVCSHPDSLPATDPARLDELPAGTRLFGVVRRLPTIERIENRLWGLYKGARATARANGNGSLPPAAATTQGPTVPRPESLTPEEMRWNGWDRRYFTRAYHAWVGHHRDAVWAHDATKIASRVGRDGRYRAVVTCGPPHMAHEAGRRIARRLACPLVMDLRDPWSLERRIWEASASPLWFWLARRAEQRCVAEADLVVTNTDEVRAAMTSRYPDHHGIVTVMNGYDNGTAPQRIEPPFTVTYAGAIYLDRDPRPLFKAASSLIRDLRLTPDQFAVQLIGDVQRYNGVPTADIARQEGISDYVRLVDRQPWDALSGMLARSAVLVSLPQDSKYAIPSKVFEYMQFGAWMLVLADDGSPVARVLEGTEADLCPPHDVDRLAQLLRSRYEAFERGERPGPGETFRPFSRRAQSDILFDRLQVLVGE